VGIESLKGGWSCEFPHDRRAIVQIDDHNVRRAPVCLAKIPQEETGRGIALRGNPERRFRWESNCPWREIPNVIDGQRCQWLQFFRNGGKFAIENLGRVVQWGRRAVGIGHPAHVVGPAVT